MLYLRHGGQLCTAPPDMRDISKQDMSHAMALHARTQYFHSDFAHTDFMTAHAASWTSPPLNAPCAISSPLVVVMLWVGTSAPSADFTASLSVGGPNGWSCVANGSTSTLLREPGVELVLPGKDMMAASSNGGYAVALPIQMALAGPVELEEGVRLRVDVAGGEDLLRVDRRVWHNHKWASTVEMQMEPQVELGFEPGPVIDQPQGQELG
eukprot:TRINITY_DN1279_c0_g1_i4.p1 TRINITY_DN1279_c0_g1~~TRINITY_DN1279_c0_g1_i4.p1  ORF type:complete len:210 (-),score=50.85 TRINITY_DN1279_c0_g1_i4:298-927(-)